MPRYYEDKPEGGACAGVKEDLGACLLQSDCVLQVARSGARGDETPEPGRQGPADVSRPAYGAVRRRDSVSHLGVEQSGSLMNLGESAVGASAPSGVKLVITKPPLWVFVKTNNFDSRNIY